MNQWQGLIASGIMGAIIALVAFLILYDDPSAPVEVPTNAAMARSTGLEKVCIEGFVYYEGVYRLAIKLNPYGRPVPCELDSVNFK